MPFSPFSPLYSLILYAFFTTCLFAAISVQKQPEKFGLFSLYFFGFMCFFAPKEQHQHYGEHCIQVFRVIIFKI